MEDVVIVGAGLAGLSCGFRLSERGRTPLILEARDQVGGRTSSWVQDGMQVESGLHRFLGFFSALPKLVKDAGIDIDKMVCWEDAFDFRLPDGGPRGTMHASILHRPFRTIGSALGNFELLSLKDKLSLGAFFLRGIEDYKQRPEALDKVTVAQYAREKAVTEAAIHNLLIPLTAGIFFLPPERYSAYPFFGLIGPYLADLHRLRIGAFSGGMTEVMAAPIAETIRGRGGRVRTGAAVDRLVMEGGRVAGVGIGDETIHARHVVLAASLSKAQELLRPLFGGDAWFAPMLDLPSMPAVTIQMELKERALELDRVTFSPGTDMASYCEQSKTTFPHVPGRISIILSPPEKYLAMKPEGVLEETLREADRLGLDLRKKLTAWRVVNHPADFYSFEPGHDSMRPEQRTPLPGLTLAGDYTRQIYLATMEGAVVSGDLACEAVSNAAE